MAFGGILIGSISGFVSAILALAIFGIGWMGALGVYAIGGTLTALLAIAYALRTRDRTEAPMRAEAEALRARG